MRLLRIAVLLAAAASSAIPWAAPVTAVGPAQFHPSGVAKSAPATMLLPAGAPSYRVQLAAPTDDERARLRAKNTAPGTARSVEKNGLALAFPRAVPLDASHVALAALPWQVLADGGRSAKIEVQSPGALAVRVALALAVSEAGVSFRFSGNGAHAQAFGPFPSSAVAADSVRFGTYWSPVLDGDVATIEIHADAGTPVPSATLTIARVAHQVVAPSSLDRIDTKAVQDIGSAAACEIDVACVSPQTSALVDSAKAVAALEFQQEDGYTYLCTGQLLNDSVSSNTPYLFSANHCLDSALAAHTLNTYWFFRTLTCGSKSVPPYVQQASGAALLARSVDFDWALVRLDAPPPAGVTFSAWRADPVTGQTPIVVLHNPEGDLEKWSEGLTFGYQQYTDGSSFAQVRYGRGTTEPGSSGAGLLTLSAGGYYELRGGLWRGSAACNNPSGVDEYSRIDTMLALTREYLTPNVAGTPPGTAAAVEYYNAALDHYFMTASPAEIGDLDAGVHPGWQRTGLRFLAYQTQAPGTSPVCRFYLKPAYGDSHFYSASPSECQDVVRKFPAWTFESASVFYIALPDTVSGACPNGTQPVWRFLNERTTNHRFTTDHATRDDMRADPATWTPEGYGPDAVVMCAPVGS